MPASVQAATAPEWTACPRCRALVYTRRLERNLLVCPECQYHARLTAPERVRQLLDPGSVEPLSFAVDSEDHLRFVDTRPYTDRLYSARLSTGLDEGVLCLRGRIDGHPVVAAVMDFRFLGGSLGAAVGEMITLAAETALADRTPLLLVTASGGARMQEGALSLMQMAKTSQALGRLDEEGILTVSLVTDPTYGGVAASFATLCDVIIAEPRARLGFAGPRVIRQTIRQSLPSGFQEAESLLANGLVDDVVPRAALRPALARLLAFAAPVVPHRRASGAVPVIHDPDRLTDEEPWATVQRARDTARPTTLDYIGYLIDGFQELRGDRSGGDCPAIVGGIGRFDGQPVVVIGHQKGHQPADLIARNFGMATPAGYRKAVRLMRLAAKVGVPVLTLIDTPGAYPGVEAEAGGQAVAIAEALRLMAALPVPIVAAVTGEGGSGGALALAVANQVLMLSGAVYSVISPEGCAAILWDDPAAAPRAASALGLRASDLLRAGIVDGVVPEPEGGAQADPLAAAAALRAAFAAALEDLQPLRPDQLIARRRSRFRRLGAPTQEIVIVEGANR
ncbi:acetyl-CoA carboxylase carboxyltransferase subunit alpha [Micromonospora sp. B11E3]|uniref:acetyl-CoA carboxylase carboxyltransferase subunit alpha n=1 Tax=Micromonospora sp. B11E3 TaxID=3153562 RepID=UPI00325DB36E